MIRRLLHRLLGIRSPSRDVSAAHAVYAEGMADGIREAEAHPKGIAAALDDFEASGALDRARRIRDLHFPDDDA